MIKKAKQIFSNIQNSVFHPLKKRFNSYMLRAALRLGGFISWYFTVLKIGELRLNDLYAAELSSSMKTAFLCAEFITLALITIFLTFYDIEKILTHKFIRFIPGILLAEGSIALALTDANTVIPFSIIAGITSAVGSAAILTSLLKVKVKHRLAAIGGGLIIAGIIYSAVCFWLPRLWENTHSSVLISGIILSVITIFTVHFEEFTGNKTKVIDRFDTKTRKEIVRKIPFEYLVFIFICTAFFFAFNSSVQIAQAQKPLDYHIFDLAAMLSLSAAAAVIMLFVRPHSICPLFAAGAALSGAAAILLNVHVISGLETTLFAVFSHAGLACFRACALLFVVTFALNRPHPFFFSVVGYTCIIFSEWISSLFMNKHPPQTDKAMLYTTIFFILLPIGYLLISRGLTRHGYTPDMIERRHKCLKILNALAEEKKLSRREYAILEQAGVNDCPVSELPDKLFISESAIQGYIKKICSKTGDKNINELLARFSDNCNSPKN